MQIHGNVTINRIQKQSTNNKKIYSNHNKIESKAIQKAKKQQPKKKQNKNKNKIKQTTKQTRNIANKE